MEEEEPTEDPGQGSVSLSWGYERLVKGFKQGTMADLRSNTHSGGSMKEGCNEEGRETR